jgi:hypothetical protein
MKITTKYLQRIIKEEVQKVLTEARRWRWLEQIPHEEIYRKGMKQAKEFLVAISGRGPNTMNSTGIWEFRETDPDWPRWMTLASHLKDGAKLTLIEDLQEMAKTMDALHSQYVEMQSDSDTYGRWEGYPEVVALFPPGGLYTNTLPPWAKGENYMPWYSSWRRGGIETEPSAGEFKAASDTMGLFERWNDFVDASGNVPMRITPAEMQSLKTTIDIIENNPWLNPEKIPRVQIAKLDGTYNR